MAAEPRGPRVAVLRALPGLGDLLCLVPALRALRRAEPAAHVTLLGLEGARWFAQRFDQLVDELLPVSHRMLPEAAAASSASAAAEAAFLERCRARRFDVAVQAHGHGPQSNEVVSALGARRSVVARLSGADVSDRVRTTVMQTRPDSYGQTVVALDEDQHEVDRLRAVAAAAGWPPAGRNLSWRRLPGDPTVSLPRPYACLHPGSSLPSRRWPPAAFACVGEHLRRRGYDIVLTGGAAEAELTAEVDRRLGGGSIDLAGRTTLAELASVIDGAEVVVCNDTGVSHLAVALRRPSVVVFTATSPARWGPPPGPRHVVVDERGRAPGALLAEAVDGLDQLLAGARG